MKKIYLSLIAAFCLTASSFAQIVVVAGADPVTLAGNPYTTLRAVFNNINAASQTGNVIVISVTGITVETATASLNQSAGPWTSLTIVPVGISQITGNINGHLIDLNGADNVTINGLNTPGNSLALNNSNGISASTLRFINDASNNTIINCNILGSSGITAGPGLGTIYFSTGVLTGNDNNTITQCSISSSAAGTPLNAIYSLGTSTALNNSGNTISINNISDYANPGVASAGLNLNSFTSGWTILNNTLYQTATRTYTTGSTHNGIVITSGSGYTISNNFIGYSAPNQTGTTNMIGLNSGSLGGTFPSSFTSGGVSNATRFVGINCAFTANGTVSSIQNNNIGGIALYTSSGATTTFGTLCGISVTSGNANIGTITGNTIGSATATSSLYVASTSGGGVISGIYCTTSNTISIQNNTIGGIDASGISAGTGQGFKGIEGAGSGTYTISNNNIGNTSANNIRTGYLLTGANLSNTATTPTSATGAAAVQGILSSATGTTMSITNNTVRGFQISGSNSPFTGINSAGAVTGTITISNNNLGTSSLGLINIMFANSSGILCMNNTGGTAACALIANNNTFQGVTYYAEGSGSFRCMNNSAALLSATFNNNNFNNLTVNSSGQTFGFLIGATSNALTVVITGNYVTTQFTNTTTTGASNLLAIACASGAPASGSTTITNNNLSNITYRTTTSFGSALYWDNGNAAGTTHNINVSNNVFSNITNQGTATTAGNIAVIVGFGNSNTISNNTISSIYGKASISALQTNANSLNAAGVFNIFNNKIYDIVTSGASSTATGLQSLSGPASNVYKNIIFDIKSLAGSTVVGLQEGQATAGTTANIYNNIIGRLYAPNNGFYNGVTGIYSGSAVANTKNFYYNTVYLDGSNPTQSYCLYSNSIAPTVNLANNIFSNNITPTGGSLFPSMVYFRNGASSLGTYAATSNNNIFYAGTPGASNIMYGDGAVNALTNIQITLANFQAFVSPRETNSKTEVSPFLNTTNGLGGQYLHLNSATATLAESGAVNIATYTDDYDGEIRQGNPGYAGTGTAPDIGADEIESTVDKVNPDINYTPLTNTSCLTNRTFTATVSDASGINSTMGTKPRVYYKVSTNANSLGATNDNTTDGWKYAEATNAASPYSFTIDYALIFGAVSPGSNVQYFVTAQDLATTPNVGINSGSFTTAPASVSLTATAFPITGLINNYNVTNTIATSITIGAAGTYTSLTSVNGLFADINTKGLSGNTVVNIIDPSVTESGLYSLNQIANGCLANYTLTIKPNAAGTTLTGAINNQPLLKIKSNNVIIDGSSNGTASQDLTITNTSVTGSGVLLFGSTGTTPITNSTLKNCFIVNGVNTSSAVIVSDGLTPTIAGYFSNISIQNNNIQRAFVGIYSIAVATSGNGSGLNISSNSLNTSGANAIRNVGIYVQGVDGAMVSGNDIGNFETVTSEIDRGIWFANGTTNSVMELNKIHDLQYTGTAGYGTKGVAISTGLAAANISVRNNMISGMTGDGRDYLGNGATFSPTGIHAFGTGQGGVNIYYNSIHLYGTTLNFDAFSESIGIALDNNTTATIKDNIVHNELGLLAATGFGAVGIAAFTSAAQFTSLDYNDYFVNAASGVNNIGSVSNTYLGSLAAWQGFSGQEANSLNVQPNFTSASDLHLVASTNCRLDGYGTPIAGITTDIDANTRDAGASDMGADEFTTTPAPSTMTTASNCDTKNVSPLGTLYIDGTCNLIAKVLPSGGAAVAGKITTCVTLDGTQQYFNGQPYVQRHYDIEPTVSNQTTTSATITLYFTDLEFTNYNTLNPAWPKMPTSAGGGNGDPFISNVKVTQFHGVGTGSPTSPGNYPGVRLLVTPLTVFYNGSFWEITFNVAGFSGFYVHTNFTNSPLPIIVNYLTGRRQGSNHILSWKVTCATSPRATMILERSADGRNYSDINSITADAARCNQPFDYTDADPLKGMNYYRLRIIDADGKVTYSTTVALLNAVKGFDIISIAPNPVVNDKFNLNVTSAQAGKIDIIIFDIEGRLVNRQTITLIAGYNSMPVNVANIAAGTYTIKGSMAGDESKVIRFVKQ